ncbi:hypothetical protein ACH5RR_005563 [Cinchona calisaya]|uniref:Small auxin up regulated protein n=1 Tax=Cinchona calisaya TaxID=153742 RepID=A0ABD3ALK8_9GENT
MAVQIFQWLLKMLSGKICRIGHLTMGKNHRKKLVPRGCFPVYVGLERRRYVLSVSSLSSIILQALLNAYEDEIQAMESITLPCSTLMFEAILALAKDEIPEAFLVL